MEEVEEEKEVRSEEETVEKQTTKGGEVAKYEVAIEDTDGVGGINKDVQAERYRY